MNGLHSGATRFPSKGKFQEIEFLKPEFSKQETFGRVFEQHREYVDQLGKSTREASDLFASLSQRAFRGEL